jgi:hypothetical protein
MAEPVGLLWPAHGVAGLLICKGQGSVGRRWQEGQQQGVAQLPAMQAVLQVHMLMTCTGRQDSPFGNLVDLGS